MCRYFDVIGIFFCIVKFRVEIWHLNEALLTGRLHCTSEYHGIPSHPGSGPADTVNAALK
jgi:hypothetical protein